MIFAPAMIGTARSEGVCIGWLPGVQMLITNWFGVAI